MSFEPARGGVGGQIAIIGMACLFPGAPDLDAYWRNIVDGVDAVSDPPPEAWDARLHYDPSGTDPDKVYCKRGGYLSPLAQFDPLEHGIPPMAVGGEPDQWLALKLARDALADAGYAELDAAVRARTAVILGKGTYLNTGNLTAVQHGLIVSQTLDIIKSLHPDMTQAELDLLHTELVRHIQPITAETVPGLIPNVIVGRIANRLDLMGPSHTVDAACASSLVAVEVALHELNSGGCDLALVGGSQVTTPVPTLNVFCKLGALSRTEQIRPFDKDADGTLLGEGIGMVVLKRLKDAERDHDRIYAVIKGVGVASDGRGVGVMAPRIEGEELALRRAYGAAGIDPSSAELIEAHGTGTPVGDVVEVQALARVLGERDGRLPHVALGSVKSMISHTMPAAGAAALIKTALALHQKVLPPTLHVSEPNPKLELERTPLYLNTATRPWVHGGSEPRRAGINAFGFGGINAHLVVEEYTGGSGSPSRALPEHAAAWDSEVCLISAPSKEELIARAEQLAGFLDPAVQDGARPAFRLVDLAASLVHDRTGADQACLAIVANSLGDLHHKLQSAVSRLRKPGRGQIKDPSGVYYFAEPLARQPGAKVAALFPGEGAQYAGMLADLCVRVPAVRAVFDQTDRIFAGQQRWARPSQVVFPPPLLGEAERGELDRQLWQIAGAIEAVLTANHALWLLAQQLGLRPDLVLGHSTGEYSAMRAAGLLDLADEANLARFAISLNEAYQQSANQDRLTAAGMLAVGAPRERVEALIQEADGDLFIGMDNCPHQAVIVGERAAVERARSLAERDALIYEFLAFERAYHTPLFRAYADHLRAVFAQTPLGAPSVPVYSCTTGSAYPTEADAVRELMLEHWQRPVEFRKTIETLYDEGVRLFVEVGPRGNLSAFVEDCLRGKAFCVAPMDVQRRSGITQLNHWVGLLLAHGLELDVAQLFAGRAAAEPVDWRRSEAADSRRSEPAAQPRPRGMRLRTGVELMSVSPEVAAQLRRPAASAPHDEPQPTPVAEMDAGLEATMAGYLETLQQFLHVQDHVLSTYLEHATAHPMDEVRFPLLGAIVDCTPGERLVAERQFDLAEDLYLADHTLGRPVSLGDPDLTGLPVLPLTLSLELIAEAAAFLEPDKQVVRITELRANRWVSFEDGPQLLQVSAERRSDGIAVEVRNRTEDAERTVPSPVLSAVVHVAEAYPTPPAPLPLERTGAQPSRLTPAMLYRDVLFHGPRWQAVSAIEETGPGHAIARLQVLPLDTLLAGTARPRFELDPIVLDAAGQVIGFWTAERLDAGHVIFPYRLDVLDVYGPQRPTGEPITCQAAITLLSDYQMRSDLDVLDASGRVWMRLVGWEDRRFNSPGGLAQLIPMTERVELSSPLDAAMPGLAGLASEARVLRAELGAEAAFWKRVWAACVLSRRERAVFRALRTPEPHQLGWLASRTAAKEAVRALVRQVAGADVACTDIDIVSDAHGRPCVAAVGGYDWLTALPQAPVISLAHTGTTGVALAAWATTGHLGLGIDAEPLGRDINGLAEIGLAEAERDLLRRRLGPAAGDAEWLLRCWCAKEAAGKALGLGLPEGPSNILITDLDLLSGTVQVVPRGPLARARGADPAAPLAVRTWRSDSLIGATCITFEAQLDGVHAYLDAIRTAV